MDYKKMMGYGDVKKVTKKISKPKQNKIVENIKSELNEGVGTRDGVCCHDCKIENIINDIFRGE